MRGGVVALDRRAALLVHGRDHGGALGQGPLRELALVEQDALRGFLRIGDFEPRALARGDGAGVADLAAGLGVEGGLLQQEFAALAFGEGIHQLSAGQDGDDFGAVGERGIARERRLEALFDEMGDEIVLGGRAVFARGAGAGALFVHAAVERRLVDVEALFGGHQDGEVEGEAVGVVELEGLLAGEHGRIGLLQFGDGFVEVGDAAVEGGGEGFLLGAQGADDFLAAGGQFGEEAAHLLFEDGEQLAEEGLHEADVAAVAGGAAQQAAQDVAAAVVGGHDAVGDGERQRAQVVGDDPHGHGGFVLEVGLAGELGDGLDEGHEDVGVVVGRLALDDGDDALEAHAGVHALGRQFVEGAVGLAVVLHEDVVPDLDDLGRAGVDHVRRAAVGGQVEMDFRARAAGAGLAHFPEVVLLAEAQDVVGIDVGAGAPDVGGLVVGLVDGDPEAVLGELPDFRQEFPGPGNGLALVVVAEGPVAEHLEKRVVVGVAADFLEVVVLARDADALLGVGDALPGRLAGAEEDFLELVHARVREQQRGIRREHDGRRGHDLVPLRGEEVEERLADLGGRHHGKAPGSAFFHGTEKAGGFFHVAGKKEVPNSAVFGVFGRPARRRITPPAARERS